MFKDGTIHDVVITELAKHVDQRGWLIEFFRQDELQEQFYPVMGYVSTTMPGIARGPHEHHEQADLFAFIGPSTFKIYLWDMRKNSPSYLNKMVFLAGVERPLSVVVPPGVVHAYKNAGETPGMVLNLPNRLFAGKGKKEAVDEIRHENDPQQRFPLD